MFRPNPGTSHLYKGPRTSVDVYESNYVYSDDHTFSSARAWTGVRTGRVQYEGVCGEREGSSIRTDKHR